MALTGATGFIGRALVRTLLAEGYSVRALTRRKQRPVEGLRWAPGSLADPSSLAGLVAGAEAIIHCAGRVRGRGAREFDLTNVAGTRNLLDAVVAAHVATAPPPRFLLISSLAAREPGLSWYAQSKYLGEQAARRYRDRLALAIYRPTAVYGPGDKEMAPLFKLSKRGMLPAVGRPVNRISLLHVDDLVAAVRADCPPDGADVVVGTYELDDGRPGGYDYATLAGIAEKAWRRKVVLLPVPMALLRLVAAVNLALARLFRYSPMLTPPKLREIRHPDWVCDNEPLTAASGWRPTIRLADALPTALTAPH